MTKLSTPEKLAIRMSVTRRVKTLPWSPEEDARLRLSLTNGEGFNGAAIALTRTPKAIRARAAKLGIKVRR